MEFTSTGNDTPHEATGEARELDERSLRTGSDFGSAAIAAETGLSVSGQSALDHVPQVADEPVETTLPEAAPAAAEENTADALVQNILGDVGRTTAGYEADVAQSDVLTEKVTALRKERAQVEARITQKEQDIAAAYAAGRVHLWEALSKNEDGLTSGDNAVRQAVALSPSMPIEDATVRDARITAAVEASSQIRRGVPAVMRYENYGCMVYQGAIPAHDGFAIIYDRHNDQYLVGVDEPAVPVAQAWVARPAPGLQLEGAPWGTRQTIEVHAGDAVAPYLRNESERTLVEVEATDAKIREIRGSAIGAPQTERSLMIEKEELTRQAVNAINAAREAGVALYTKPYSATQSSVVHSLTNRLFEASGGLPGNPMLIPIGEALQHVYPPNRQRDFVDYLTTRSLYAHEHTPGTHRRAAIAEVLVEVCGLEQAEANALLHIE